MAADALAEATAEADVAEAAVHTEADLLHTVDAAATAEEAAMGIAMAVAASEVNTVGTLAVAEVSHLHAQETVSENVLRAQLAALCNKHSVTKRKETELLFHNFSVNPQKFFATAEGSHQHEKA